MSIFLDELQPLRLFRGKFYYPIDMKDRMKNSIVYLMTPNKESTIKTLNHPLSIQTRTMFKSYFIEKNVQLIINNQLHENKISINNEEYNCDNALLESVDYSNKKDILLNKDNLEILDEDNRYKIFFNDVLDEVFNINEDTFKTKYGVYNLSSIFRKILYDNRMKTQKDCILLYNEIKKAVPFIKYAFVDPKIYKNKNLYYDWSYYTEVFFKNNKSFKSERALDVFFSFIERFIHDKRFSSYNHRTIVIPVIDWVKDKNTVFDYKVDINPISLLYRQLRVNPSIFDAWKDYLLVFLSSTGFFTLDFKQFKPSGDLPRFHNNILKLIGDDFTVDEDINRDSKKVILNHLVDKINKGGIEIHNLTGSTKELSKKEIENLGLMQDPEATDDAEIKKAALVNKLEDIADKSTSTDDAMKMLDSNEMSKEDEDWIKNVLIDLQNDSGIKMDKARTARMDKVQKAFLEKEVDGKSVKQLLDQFQKNEDIPETSIPIDSIDDHWKHVKFPNFNSMYTKEDMEADIVAVFNHFSHITRPLSILRMEKQDTSTAEDYIDTWSVSYEEADTGNRYRIVVDMPKIIGDRFMKLAGNEKVLIGQLMLLPITKTDTDTVQIVSNFNKIFVRLKSPTGKTKTSATVNRLCKALEKKKYKDFTIIYGDNTKVCKKYALPISYVDMAGIYSKIEFKDGSYISFNMDNLKDIPFDRTTVSENDSKLPEEDLNRKYLAIYVKDGKKQALVDITPDSLILEKMREYSEDFINVYNTVPASRRLAFSEGSILKVKIPIIVMCAYAIGLQRAIDRANIKYEFSEKRPSKDKNYITFNDGYLVYYPKSDADNILMNGLAMFDTKDYSIKQINSRDMWIEVLDNFGGREKAYGLDGFYDLMMDPITVEICKILNIPTDYIGCLLYASSMLTTNSFNRHADITGNRLRTNEIIVGHLYQVLSRAYYQYDQAMKKNNRQAQFSINRKAVINSVLTHDQTSSDLSTLTPLLEAESANKVTFKGLSGLNSERAYGMDKRAYDKSMIGILGVSTGFASTIGVNRQLTLDAGVLNKRGFLAPKKPEEMDTLNSFTIMETTAPFTANRDDPMRICMGFIQQSQHQMIVRGATPSLISMGTDEALPYLTSNKFSYKFKGKKGTIKEINENYIVVQDDDTKECDYIDLRETIQKNSDGGFYVVTKLDANKGLKVGSKVKFNDILAWDKSAYSRSIGNQNAKNPNGISYNMGVLATVAIMNTDMGFEDSCVVDEYTSHALETELCVMKDVNLDAGTNIYNMVKVGDPIEEGEPLLVFQESFDDEDANKLLASISKDNPEITDIGRKQLHSKVSGIVQDIKIYRTCELNELSPSLKKVTKQYEDEINGFKKVMDKYNIDKKYTLETTSKSQTQGKLKAVEHGVKIEFFVKTTDFFSDGDKLVFSPSALKGVCSYVIPKDKIARREYRPNEAVSAFLTVSGSFARMTPSCYLFGLTTKLIIELTRQCQEELGIKWKPIQEIMEQNSNPHQ